MKGYVELSKKIEKLDRENDEYYEHIENQINLLNMHLDFHFKALEKK